MARTVRRLYTSDFQRSCAARCRKKIQEGEDIYWVKEAYRAPRTFHLACVPVTETQQALDNRRDSSKPASRRRGRRRPAPKGAGQNIGTSDADDELAKNVQAALDAEREGAARDFFPPGASRDSARHPLSPATVFQPPVAATPEQKKLTEITVKIHGVLEQAGGADLTASDLQKIVDEIQATVQGLGRCDYRTRLSGVEMRCTAVAGHDAEKHRFAEPDVAGLIQSARPAESPPSIEELAGYVEKPDYEALVAEGLDRVIAEGNLDREFRRRLQDILGTLAGAIEKG